MKLTTKEITLSAVFAAIICVMSVITIPVGVIPITLGLFGIMITAVMLGAKKGLLSVLIFILAGAIGLPVFSGFKGGFQVLAGPTGGYISSYILVALVIGFVSDKVKSHGLTEYIFIFLSCCIGIAICYAIGTAQFMAVSGSNLQDALAKCVILFIPFDLIKALAATFLGITVKKRLRIS